MVNNSSNINKMNNHLSSQTIEHNNKMNNHLSSQTIEHNNKITTYGVWNPGPGLAQILLLRTYTYKTFM